MIRFNSDYTEGCHKSILEKLVETIWSRQQAMEKMSIADRRES